MSTQTRAGRALVLLTTAALALSACGSDEGNGSGDTAAGGGLTGTIAGAGASSQTAAMQSWIAGFQTENEGATINYDPVGSGGGREQFTSGGVQFAGSDRALKPEEVTAASARCAPGGAAIDLPLYISPIAVAFNLSGIDTLNLKPDIIANIFAQKITKWNDPAIAIDNPDADLPDLDITPVNRSDDSGTTENFTDYLSKASSGAWTFPVSGKWPVAGGEAANGTSGVIAAIEGAEGAIGYADASQVGELGKASVGVGDAFEAYSPESAAAVVADSPREEGRGPGDIAIEVARDTTAGGNYPIVLVSYVIVCNKYQDAAQADLVKGFLTYVSSEAGQTAAASSAGSAPISADLRTEITATVGAISGP